MKWTSVVWRLSHWSSITDAKAAESGSLAADSSIREASVSSWASSGDGVSGTLSDLVGGSAESGGALKIDTGSWVDSVGDEWTVWNVDNNVSWWAESVDGWSDLASLKFISDDWAAVNVVGVASVSSWASSVESGSGTWSNRDFIGTGDSGWAADSVGEGVTGDTDSVDGGESGRSISASGRAAEVSLDGVSSWAESVDGWAENFSSVWTAVDWAADVSGGASVSGSTVVRYLNSSASVSGA